MGGTEEKAAVVAAPSLFRRPNFKFQRRNVQWDGGYPGVTSSLIPIGRQIFRFVTVIAEELDLKARSPKQTHLMILKSILVNYHHFPYFPMISRFIFMKLI